jgi:hypothetical protein
MLASAASVAPVKPARSVGDMEVRIGIPMSEPMSAWIHERSFDLGLGIRGKSVVVRDALGDWLAEMDAMTAAARTECLVSLRREPVGETTLYQYSVSSAQFSRLQAWAADPRLRLSYAAMVRDSVRVAMSRPR